MKKYFKRVIAILLAIAIMLSLSVTAFAAGFAKLGDVNLDGKIDITDATEIQLYLAEFITLSDEQKSVADANCDGSIDIIDSTCIQMNVAEMEVNSITYNVENADVQAYMAKPAYDANDYSYTNFTGTTIYDTDRPASGVLTVPNGAGKIKITSSEDGKYFEDAVFGSTYNVKNLIPNITYYYEMYDNSNKVVKTGNIYPTGQIRMIDSGGTTRNIRDLGGWKADGGTLKYGLLYRGGLIRPVDADRIYNYKELTEGQKSYFKNFLGISSEINLRGAEDPIDGSGFGSDVDYHNYSVNPYGSAVNISNPNHAVWCAVFKQVVADLSAGKSIYFHCAAGADRAGTMAFLIEAVCGVSQSDLDRDYELTSFYTDRLRTGASYNTDIIKYLNNNVTGATLRDKVVNTLLSGGVTLDEINTLRNIMIDGSPAPLTVS